MKNIGKKAPGSARVEKAFIKEVSPDSSVEGLVGIYQAVKGQGRAVQEHCHYENNVI